MSLWQRKGDVNKCHYYELKIEKGQGKLLLGFTVDLPGNKESNVAKKKFDKPFDYSTMDLSPRKCRPGSTMLTDTQLDSIKNDPEDGTQMGFGLNENSPQKGNTGATNFSSMELPNSNINANCKYWNVRSKGFAYELGKNMCLYRGDGLFVQQQDYVYDFGTDIKRLEQYELETTLTEDEKYAAQLKKQGISPKKKKGESAEDVKKRKDRLHFLEVCVLPEIKRELRIQRYEWDNSVKEGDVIGFCVMPFYGPEKIGTSVKVVAVFVNNIQVTYNIVNKYVCFEDLDLGHLVAEYDKRENKVNASSYNQKAIRAEVDIDERNERDVWVTEFDGRENLFPLVDLCHCSDDIRVKIEISKPPPFMKISTKFNPTGKVIEVGSRTNSKEANMK